jgi:phosphate transport system permease protein
MKHPYAGLKLRDPRFRRRQAISRLMSALVALSTLVTVGVLLLVLGYVVVKGAPALNWAFFTERPLPFGEVGGGVGPAVIGTVYMLAVAGLVGVPVGMGTGIYLSEYGRGRFASAVRFAIDLVAGLPSIVVGVFVWALLVRNVIGQYSALAGAMALAIIMVPIISRTVEEVLRLVPDSLREAALALGVPRWKAILRVVVPTAQAGVVTGVVLSLARAGGETAPLLLTALGNQFFSNNLLAPMAALPVQIYTYAMSPYEDWHTKAWGGALVLMAVLGVMSLLVRLVGKRQT